MATYPASLRSGSQAQMDDEVSWMLAWPQWPPASLMRTEARLTSQHIINSRAAEVLGANSEYLVR